MFFVSVIEAMIITKMFFVSVIGAIIITKMFFVSIVGAMITTKMFFVSIIGAIVITKIAIPACLLINKSFNALFSIFIFTFPDRNIFMKKNNNPCHYLKISLFAGLVACLISLNSFSQTATPEYLSLTFIKLNDASKAGSYEALLKYYGKAYMQYRYKHGDIDGWYADEVIMPSGSANEYDIVVGEMSKNMQVLVDDTLPVTDIFKKVFPGITDEILEGVFSQYESMRKIVKTEIFRVLDTTHASKTMPLYTKMNFAKATPGNDSLYEALEENSWIAFHQLRMKKGFMADWELDKKLMPQDIHAEYDYLTVDYYNRLDGMTDTQFMQEAKTLWTDAERTKILSMTGTSRTIVRSEIWKLIDYVDERNITK